MGDVSELESRIRRWCRGRPDILAAAVVGSHARGDARPDSDVDVVLVARHPESLTDDPEWTAHFAEPERIELETWGVVTSLRVHYAGGMEVEWAIAPEDWAHVPADAGTRRVVEDGLRIVYDPEGALARLVRAVCGSPARCS